jgi:hypothetical protein
MKARDVLVFLFFVVFSMGVFPYFQDAIIKCDMGSWTFVGHEFVASLLPVTPYLFIVCSVLVPLYFMFKEEI